MADTFQEQVACHRNAYPHLARVFVELNCLVGRLQHIPVHCPARVHLRTRGVTCANNAMALCTTAHNLRTLHVRIALPALAALSRILVYVQQTLCRA